LRLAPRSLHAALPISLLARAAADGCAVDDELCFRDDGFSGSTLLRPALERLRDQAAAGAIDRLYVLDPDRLARNYAYQFLLMQEDRKSTRLNSSHEWI